MQYTVSVRTLCEFTAKRGDLDLRFTPSPTAEEGIAGHKQVSGSRGGRYETEISLHGEFQSLIVRGRADGYDPALSRLEEIKTHRGDLELQAPGASLGVAARQEVERMAVDAGYTRLLAAVDAANGRALKFWLKQGFVEERRSRASSFMGEAVRNTKALEARLGSSA